MAYPSRSLAIKQIQEFLRLKQQQDPNFLVDSDGKPIELSGVDGKLGPKTIASIQAWIKQEGDLKGVIDADDAGDIKKNLETVWHTMRVDLAFDENLKKTLEDSARDKSLTSVQRGMVQNMLGATPAGFVEQRDTFRLPADADQALSSYQQTVAKHTLSFLERNDVDIKSIPGLKDGDPVDTVGEFKAIRQYLQQNPDILRKHIQAVVDDVEKSTDKSPTKYLSESRSNQTYMRELQSTMGMFSEQFATRVDGDLGPNGSGPDKLKQTSHTLQQMRNALGLDRPEITLDTVPVIEERLEEQRAKSSGISDAAKLLAVPAALLVGGSILSNINAALAKQRAQELSKSYARFKAANAKSMRLHAEGELRSKMRTFRSAEAKSMRLYQEAEYRAQLDTFRTANANSMRLYREAELRAQLDTFRTADADSMRAYVEADKRAKINAFRTADADSIRAYQEMEYRAQLDAFRAADAKSVRLYQEAELRAQMDAFRTADADSMRAYVEADQRAKINAFRTADAESVRLYNEAEQRARLNAFRAADADSVRAYHAYQEAEYRAKLDTFRTADAESIRLYNEAEQRAKLRLFHEADADSMRAYIEAEQRAKINAFRTADADSVRAYQEMEYRAQLDTFRTADVDSMRLYQEAKLRAQVDAFRTADADSMRAYVEAEQRAKINAFRTADAASVRLYQEAEYRAQIDTFRTADADSMRAYVEAEYRAKVRMFQTADADSMHAFVEADQRAKINAFRAADAESVRLYQEAERLAQMRMLRTAEADSVRAYEAYAKRITPIGIADVDGFDASQRAAAAADIDGTDRVVGTEEVKPKVVPGIADVDGSEVTRRNVAAAADIDGAGRVVGETVLPAAIASDVRLQRAVNPMGEIAASTTSGTGKWKWGRALGKSLFVVGGAFAAYEIGHLEAAAAEALNKNHLSEKALIQYQGFMAAHAAQAVLDPTLVGGEVPLQEGYNAWAASHGLSSDLTEKLRPSSLIKMVGDAFSTGKLPSLSQADQNFNEINLRLTEGLPADAPPQLKELLKLRENVIGLNKKLISTLSSTEEGAHDQIAKVMEQMTTATEAYRAAFDGLSQSEVSSVLAYIRQQKPTEAYLGALKKGWNITRGPEAARISEFNGHFGKMTPEMAYQYGLATGFIAEGTSFDKAQDAIKLLQGKATAYDFYRQKGLIEADQYRGVDTGKAAVIPQAKASISGEFIESTDLDAKGLSHAMYTLERAAGNVIRGKDEIDYYGRMASIRGLIKDGKLVEGLQGLSVLSGEVKQIAQAKLVTSLSEKISLTRVQARFPEVVTHTQLAERLISDRAFRREIQGMYDFAFMPVERALKAYTDVANTDAQLRSIAKKHGITLQSAGVISTTDTQKAILAKAHFESASGLSASERKLYRQLYDQAREIAQQYVDTHGKNLSATDKEALFRHITNFAQFGPIDIPAKFDVKTALSVGKTTGLLNLRAILAKELDIPADQLHYQVKIDGHRVQGISYLGADGRLHEVSSDFTSTLNKRLAWLSRYHDPLSQFMQEKKLPALAINGSDRNSDLQGFRTLKSDGQLRRGVIAALQGLTVSSSTSFEVRKLARLYERIAQRRGTMTGFNGITGRAGVLLNSQINRYRSEGKLRAIMKELGISPYQDVTLAENKTSWGLFSGIRKLFDDSDAVRINRIVSSPSLILNDTDDFDRAVKLLTRTLRDNPSHPQAQQMRHSLHVLYVGATKDSNLLSRLTKGTVDAIQKILGPTIHHDNENGLLKRKDGSYIGAFNQHSFSIPRGLLARSQMPEADNNNSALVRKVA